MKNVIEYSLKVNGIWKIKILSFVVRLLNLKQSDKVSNSDFTIYIEITTKQNNESK